MQQKPTWTPDTVNQCHVGLESQLSVWRQSVAVTAYRHWQLSRKIRRLSAGFDSVEGSPVEFDASSSRGWLKGFRNHLATRTGQTIYLFYHDQGRKVEAENRLATDDNTKNWGLAKRVAFMSQKCKVLSTSDILSDVFLLSIYLLNEIYNWYTVVPWIWMKVTLTTPTQINLDAGLFSNYQDAGRVIYSVRYVIRLVTTMLQVWLQ